MKKIYTEGRPPWYDSEGSIKEPVFIGVAGGSGSGKTTVCTAIISQVGLSWVTLLNMDSFYRNLTVEEKARAAATEYNFDHPNSFDMDCLLEVLSKLKEGKSTMIPEYDFVTHSRVDGKGKVVYGADVVILEGIFVLYDTRIRDLLDMKIFVDTADDIRLARRLRRDIVERGRKVETVLMQYEKFVKPSFDDYIEPTRQYADIIVPRGADNHVAIHLIASHVKHLLTARGWQPMQKHKVIELKPTIHVLKMNDQIRYIETILRNKETPRDDFIFYSERIVRLLIEEALSFTPFIPKVVETPVIMKEADGVNAAVHATYSGGVFASSKICGVSLMRAGDAMLQGLQQVVKDPLMGTILINSDVINGPRLHFYRLPPKLTKDHYVLLLDPTIGSGNTLLMAIRLLLDHNVQQDHIIMVTICACHVGLCMVTHYYPKIHVVCAFLDEVLDEKGRIIPGIGHFGDRYYGTEKTGDEED